MLVLALMGGLVSAVVALADEGRPASDVVVGPASSLSQATQDHDLAVVSFDPLFVGKPVSGDKIAFAFEITNLDKLPDTGDWKIVSDNTTTDPADDVVIGSGSAKLDPGFSLKSGPTGISWDTTGAELGTHTVTLSVDAVAGETTTANNTRSLVVTLVERPTHDVAVTGIQPVTGDGSPLGAVQVPTGTKININVTTRNRGSVTETFGLTLTETQNTTVRGITNVNVTLDSGDELTLGLVWDTLGVTPGSHKLTATATASGDQDTSNDSKSADVAISIVLAQITITGADAIFPPDPTNAPLVMADPNINTTVQPLSKRFIRNHDALFGDGIALVQPVVTTEVEELTKRFVRNQDATFGQGLTLQNPNVSTQVEELSKRFIRNHDAVFGDPIRLVEPVLTTQVLELTRRYIRNQDALFGDGVAVRDPNVSTEVIELAKPFIANASAVFGQGLKLRNPFTEAAQGASIRSGSGIHRQGRTESTGAYLWVNGEVHFVDRLGQFDFIVEPKTYRIEIRAPGYVPVRIVSKSNENIKLEGGDVLIIPDINIPFGDANGDGAIDVRDLGIQALNLGTTSPDVDVPVLSP